MTVEQTGNVAGALAFDTRSLDELKLQAKSDPAKAVAGAAKQFEGLFLGMVLKSMRAATPQDGMFDNEQTKLYSSLLDQQLANHIAARGTGLSQVMARQLSGAAAAVAPKGETSLLLDPAQVPSQLATLALARLNPDATAAAAGMAGKNGASISRDPAQAALQLSTLALARLDPDATAAAAAVAADDAEPEPFALPPSMHERVARADAPGKASSATDAVSGKAASATDAVSGALAKTSDFVNRIWTHAVDAARSIGTQPRFVVGQAALESGWGKHEIRKADGSSSHNLFGVKAGTGWNGPVVEKTTTEYVNGAAQKTTAKFRVYGSYAEAFKDYASLLRNNPRYAGVAGQSQDAKGFATGLQRAGYATDPAYADKLVRVINGSTLRVALQGDPPSQMLAQR
jgi:flagellar protein FlgJ